MKHSFPVFLLALLTSLSCYSQGVWTWMHGDKAANINRVYGTQGVAAAGNTPGGRIGSSYWTDRQGNLWLFGGKGNSGLAGNGVLNDLWMYNTSTNQWAWMGGDKELSPKGVFIEKGEASAANKPGGRQNGVSWLDNAGNFWLFGGQGIPSQAAGEDEEGDFSDESVFLNDLWKYSPATGQWTFVSGTPDANERGVYGAVTVASPSNYPGGRYSASGWKDNNGNLWLFGGRGYSSQNDVGQLSDVWKYSPSNNVWTWMSGDDQGEADRRYGQKGSFANANTPGGRHGCMSWTDNSGNFWLYGGGTQVDLFGDLWRYDFNNGRWAWISGSNIANQQPKFSEAGVAEEDSHPGARTLSAVWVDEVNDVWMFGGNGYGGASGSDPLNNLWKYSISANEWTFVKGDISNASAEYGSKGVADADNNPGGTGNLSFWKDGEGDFWIFGGRRNTTDYVNQVWRLKIGCDGNVSGSISPASASICEDASVELTATGGTSYEWMLDGVKIPNQTGATLNAEAPGTYSVTIINGECRGPASNTTVITRATAPTGSISPASASICEGGSTVLTATGGTSYEWMLDGVKIPNETGATLTAETPGTYSVTIINGECRGPASNTTVITRATAPTGSISPASASICEGGSTILTATGGTSYEWMLDGIKIPNQTGATLTANAPGTYSVTIINGECRGPASNTTLITRATAPTGTISPASASICEGGSTILTATGGTSYEWMLNGVKIPNQTGATLTAETSGTYSGTIINGECRGPASNTTVITRATAPTGTISPASASICEGGSTILTATGGTSYEWMLDGVKIPNETSATLTAETPGTYSVTIINGECRGPASNTTVITRATAPTGSISPASASICEGGSTILTATGGTSYEWMLDGVKIPNQTGATLTANAPGTYSVTIINGECRGPASNTTVIILATAPTGSISPASASICEGGSMILTATGGTSYEWMLDGVKIPNETSATLTANAPGTYSVTIINGSCKGPASNTSTISIIETLGVRYTDITTKENTSIRLSARNIGTQWEWTPATGLDDPSSVAPLATLTSDQLYIINITNEQGCSITDTQFVKVTPSIPNNNNPGKVGVPTAFTPNSNNINDRLRPLGNIRKLDYFRVYNRWGILVFQTNKIGEGWDGRHKGTMQAADTFSWIMMGETTDGQPIKLSGKTVLIR